MINNGIWIKINNVLTACILAVFLISSSVLLAILLRDIYYLQIRTLQLPQQTGYTEETIREAFDDALDYCLKGGGEAGQTFRTGKLAFSEEGKAHFDDVAKVFRLDFIIAGASGVLLLLLAACRLLSCYVKRRRKTKGSYAPKADKVTVRRGPLFWGPVGAVSALAIAGIAAAVDFDRFFVFFHHIFFPAGDGNTWLLDPGTDEIILILPEEVFSGYGLAILVILAAECAVCIIADHLLRKHRQKIDI